MTDSMKATPLAFDPAHMSSQDRPRIPFKGTIFFSISACVGLWSLSVKVESLRAAHSSKIKALLAQTQVTDPTAAFEVIGAIDPIDLGSPVDLETQLEQFQYMPLAAFNRVGILGPGLGPGKEQPDASHIPSMSAMRAARPPGWVYPEFDMPAEGLHGPPATELPRNISFQLVDDKGMPMAYDAIQVFEQTVSGLVELHPYPTKQDGKQDGAEWSFGIRRLMTGATAYFLVEAEHEGQRRVGTVTLENPSADIQIDAGSLELRMKAESAWGTE